MEFLQPAALYSLLLLPLLLVPYWVKRRPRRLVFSSLLLFGDLAARARAGRWGRLYLPPVFFLQLLLLLLLFLALAEPSLSRRAASVALVLDNSASMQAAEGEKSRFQIARDEAAEVVRSLPAGARVELYLIAPALARVGETALTAGQALDRIAALKPLDLGEPALDYGAELGRLARERGYERVYFFTDRPADGQSPSVRVVTVGRPRGNLAVASFSVSRSSLTSPELSGRVEIKSFSPREEKFRLDVKGGGRVVASRVYTIAAGKSAAAAFENLPVYPYYEAEIAAADDGLALDNHRFAAAPPAGGLKILAVSPRPEALASLKAIPGVELQVVSPEAYRKGGFGPHALEIFHYAAPAALPDSSALFVLPPGGNPLAGIGAPAARPVISGWREPHPLTRYVNFALFRPAYARPLKLRQFGAPIIDSPDGPLAVALEQ
ncbi:MAG TPA: vWA domain-containing protein, partial [Candidatus Binatia bacterium]